MDKRGATEEFLPLLWRIGLFVAIVLVISMVSVNVFSAKQDVRPAESVALSRAVFDCVVSNGKFDETSRLGDCLNLDDEEYLIKVSVTSIDSDIIKNVSFGNPSFEEQCKFSALGVKERIKLDCKNYQYFVSVDNNGKTESAILNMLIGIGRIKENVSLK